MAKAIAKTSYADQSDELLIQAVLEGNLKAYEGIMRHHNQRLFRLARSIVTDDSEAMDVVQSAFVTAYNQLATLREPKALGLWLARIVRNEALARMRKAQRMSYMDESGYENVLSLEQYSNQINVPERQVANEQLRKILENCIDELPEVYRTVFMLRAVDGCSVKMTADILDIKEATVKTRFHRAKNLMQKRIFDFSQESGLSVHEFAAERCDAIVDGVLNSLEKSS